MKRRRTFLMVALIPVSLLGVWALLIGPWPVSYAPLDRDPAYKRTLAAFQVLHSSAPSVSDGQLFAGWGRAPITPPVPTYTAGYGKVRAHLVHDSVYARALAFRVDTTELILIGIDALIVSRDMSRRVSERLRSSLGVPEDRVLFTATHTHSGPGCWDPSWLGQRFAGPFDPARLLSLIDAMTSAAEQAHAALAPVSMAVGSFDALRYVRNRLLGNEVDVDPVFAWAAFRRDDGATAIWGAFAAHATTIGRNAGLISGDYPGAWEGSLEQGDAETAIFSAAAVGSMGPRGEGRDVARAQALGLSLADSVRIRLPHARWAGHVAIMSFRIPIILPEQQVRPESLFGKGGTWRLSPILTRRIVPMRETYLQVLVLNRLILVGMPCDFSGELARDLREKVRESGYTVVTTGFNGDYVGYVVRDEHYGMNSYETRTMSWWGPHMGKFMSDMAERAVALAIGNMAGQSPGRGIRAGSAGPPSDRRAIRAD